MNNKSPHCSKPQMHLNKSQGHVAIQPMPTCTLGTCSPLWSGVQVAWPGGGGVQGIRTRRLTKQVYCLPERLLLQPLFRIFHASALL